MVLNLFIVIVDGVQQMIIIYGDDNETLHQQNEMLLQMRIDSDHVHEDIMYHQLKNGELSTMH